MSLIKSRLPTLLGWCLGVELEGVGEHRGSKKWETLYKASIRYFDILTAQSSKYII